MRAVSQQPPMRRCGLGALVVALAVAIGAAPGCKRRDLDAVGERGTPLVLVISPTHAADSGHLEVLGAFLARESGLEVELRVVDSQDAAVAAAERRTFDAWLMPLFDYLLARQEFGIEAGLQVLRADGRRTFQGELLVRADSDATSLADLAGQRIGFVSEHSTSGFLFPAGLLRAEGVAFQSVFAGSHDAVVAALRAGRVAAAATHGGVADADPALRVLATTGEIPNEPLAFRAGLAAETRQRLMDALVAFAATEDGRRVLDRMAGITGFAPVADDAYREVHEVIQRAGKSVQDLVPGGWRLYNESRRSLADYVP